MPCRITCTSVSFFIPHCVCIFAIGSKDGEETARVPSKEKCHSCSITTGTCPAYFAGATDKTPFRAMVMGVTIPKPCLLLFYFSFHIVLVDVPFHLSFLFDPETVISIAYMQIYPPKHAPAVTCLQSSLKHNLLLVYSGYKLAKSNKLI